LKIKLLYSLANEGAIGLLGVNFGFVPNPDPYLTRIVIDEYASISCFAGEYLMGNIDTRAILKSRKTAGSSTLTIS